MGIINAILLPMLLLIWVILLYNILYIEKIKMNTGLSRKLFLNEDCNVTYAFVTLSVILFFYLLGNFISGAFIRIFTKRLVFFIISLVVCIVIACFYTISQIQSLEVRKMYSLKRYYLNMQDVLQQLQNIDILRKEVEKDETMTKEDKEEQLCLLNNSEKALRKAYSDVILAYNSMTLMITFKNVNDLKLTDESKKQLEKQIDTFEALQRL